MAFSPTISACVKSCNKLIITDTTDIYTINNDNGWNNTISASDITSATLYLYDDTLTEIEEIDVLSTVQVNDPVTGQFEFPEIDWEYEDGIYSATLIYSDGANNYATSVKFLSLAKSECCLQKAWVNFFDNDYCGKCNDEHLHELVMLDNLLYGVKAAASCIKENIVTDIISKITKFCNYNKCNC